MRRNQIDPAVAADLEALDAALAGERKDPVVDTIADEVRANAPRMSPAFAARLEAAAAAGFAGPEPARRTKRSWRPPLMPALGTACAAVIAVVIGVSAGGSDHGLSDSSSSSSSSAVESAAPSGAGGGSASSESLIPTQKQAAPATPAAPAPAADSAAGAVSESAVGQDSATVVPPPGAGPRRIQRAADLTISTPIGKLQDTADGVTATADRLGGYVYNSNVSANGDNGQATFDLRIPTTRLDEAMASLSKLGHVRSRTETSQDITARFSSALSRLTDARAERQALLRALAGASTPQEIDSIKQRLAIARDRIVAAKSELFAARRASNLARISVTVLGVAGEQGGAGGGAGKPWTPARALHDAVHVLSVAASVAIVGLAGAIPAALALLLAALAWRTYRRRRRELALDAVSAAV
jgi:hypothetical protein